MKKESRTPDQPAARCSFARDCRGGPLAEYVILLISIVMVSIGAVILLGTRTVWIIDTIVDVVDTPIASYPEGPGGPGGPGARGPGGDGSGDGDSDGEYSPGGGKVTSNDVSHGCPLVPGVEYFSDNKTTELPGWALIVLNPDVIGPGDMIPGIAFFGPKHGGWWFDADHHEAASATVSLPADVTYDLYLDKIGEFFLGGLYEYGFTDRVEFTKDDMLFYKKCSDRSGDGAPPPPDVSAGPGTDGSMSAGTGGGTGSGSGSGSGDGFGPAVMGYFDENGDGDWYRLEIPETETAVQVEITPVLVKGREAGDPRIRFRGADESYVDGVTTLKTTALVSGIATAAIYVEAMNDSIRYLGLGGYEVRARFVDDAPYPIEKADAMTIGVDVEEDILEGDAGDTFTFTTTEERAIQFVATGINGGLEDVTLTILDDTGAEVAVEADEVLAGILINPLPAGTYYARVEPRFSHTPIGDYRLSSAFVADTPYARDQAGSMTIGVDVEEDILEGDAGDTFTFTTTEERVIQFIATGINGGLEDVALTLFDSAGTEVVRHADNVQAEILANPLPAGTYYVRVEPRFDHTPIGDYRLSSAFVADTQNTRSGAAPISVGGYVEEDILPGDEGDMFMVTIPEEKDLLFVLAGVGADPLPSISLKVYDETGAELDSDSGSKATILLNDLPAGDYYILANRRFSVSDPGDYRLTVTEAIDVSPEFIDAQGLVLGTPFSEDFIATVDSDMFSFTNPTEQHIHIEIQSPEYSRFWVYDASEAEVATSPSGRTPQVLLNNFPAGDYYVKADAEYGDLMDYTLLVDGVEDALPGFAEATVISIGAPHGEGIDSTSDIDMFRFTNPTTQDVTAAVSGASTFMRLKVYDGSQVLLESKNGHKGATISMTDLPAGDYYVSVETEYSYTSDYDLEVSAP